MASSDDVREIIKEEVADVLTENYKLHDEQHKDILELIHVNAESIKAIDCNTRQLVKLHHDASTVLRVTEKIGTVFKWLLIPIAGTVAIYEWGHHTIQGMTLFK